MSDELDQLRGVTDKQATYIAELEVLCQNLGQHLVTAPVEYEAQPHLFPKPEDVGEEGVENWIRRAMQLHAEVINTVQRPVDPGSQQASR